MIARTVVIAGLGLVTVVGVAAVAAQKPAPTECTLDGKLFSLGWLETRKDQRYRCVATFDGSLQRTGIAWVRVDADGRVQVP